MLARALAATQQAGGSARTRAQVLWAAALLAILDEDYEQARAYAEEAFPLAQVSGDRRTIGRWMIMAGNAKRSIDANAAATIGAQAVEILRADGDMHGLAFALANLALSEGMRDRFDAVRERYEEFVALAGEKPSWLLPWLRTPSRGPTSARDFHAQRSSTASGRCRLEADRDPHLLCRDRPPAAAMVLAGEAHSAHEQGLAMLDRTRRAGLALAAAALERSVAAAELALGELDQAQARAERGLENPHRYTAAEWRDTLTRIALARGDARAAHEHADALRAFGQSTGSPRKIALADWAHGAAALLDGELAEACERLHAALPRQAEQGLLPEAIDSLETLGELELASNHATRGARLIASAQAGRRTFGIVCRASHPDGPEALHARCEQLLGNRYAAVFADGEAMTLQCAMICATRTRTPRTTHPRVGEPQPRPERSRRARRRRPQQSRYRQALAHLTRPVKAHLTHVYRKLDVNNRVQLAALSRKEI